MVKLERHGWTLDDVAEVVNLTAEQLKNLDSVPVELADGVLDFLCLDCCGQEFLQLGCPYCGNVVSAKQEEFTDCRHIVAVAVGQMSEMEGPDGNVEWATVVCKGLETPPELLEAHNAEITNLFWHNSFHRDLAVLRKASPVTGRGLCVIFVPLSLMNELFKWGLTRAAGGTWEMFGKPMQGSV
jgi:hypothetical protein